MRANGESLHDHPSLHDRWRVAVHDLACLHVDERWGCDRRSWSRAWGHPRFVRGL